MLNQKTYSRVRVYQEVKKVLKENWNHKRLPKARLRVFEDALQDLRVPEEERVSFTLWILTHLQEAHRDEFRHRVLHELEKDIITIDAYGLVVEAVYLQLMNWSELDEVMEDLLAQDIMPVNHGALERSLADRWVKGAKDNSFKLN